jgi:protein involved in polysaccharide export with SLBB domain
MLSALFLSLALAWLANGDNPQIPDALIQATYLVGDEPAAKANCPREYQPGLQPVTSGAAPTLATVEDNLEKLQTARQLYDLALLYERLNLPEVASTVLANVQEVCPGSRIALLSLEHYNALAAETTNKLFYGVAQHSQSGYQPAAGGNQAGADCPKEGAKVTQVAYVIEPPDLLTVELSKPLPDRPLTGERLVRTDGTINLGFYGSVQVSGLTIDQARERVENYLSSMISNPKVHLDVYAYNSKGYYVIAEDGAKGNQTVRLPFTGNETVLDAVAQIGGLPPTSNSARIWLARPGTGVLPIDWNAIVKRGDPSTNYQIQPMDRIYIATAPAQRSEVTTGGILKLTGGEEAEAITTAKDSKLSRILTSYRHACSDGNVDLARQLAIEALAIDPTCFGR